MSAFLHSLNSLDFVLIACMVLFALMGFMRGFARTLAGIMGVLISVIGAFLGSGILTPMAADYFHRMLIQVLASPMPSDFEMQDRVAGAVVSAIQSSLIRPIIFSLCYLVCITLWLYACNYLGILSRFHSLKKLDQLAGAAVGGAKGAVVLCVVVYALGQFHVLPQNVMDASLLVQAASDFSRALIG